MSNIWSHADLGSFDFDMLGWTKPINLPAFAAFTAYPEYKEKQAKLIFSARATENIPSSAAVSVAKKAIANQSTLVGLVVKSLWESFTGKGPEIAIWWYNNLEEVAAVMEDDDLAAPMSATDLYAALSLTNVRVHESFRRYKKPIAILHFAATFEEEHGLDLLTDGDAILGLGYSNEADFFDPPT